MKLSRILLTSATAIAITGGALSSAALAGNEAIIIQDGVYNTATANQSGRNSDIVIEQYGYDNLARARQRSYDNGAAILQDGVFNEIELHQSRSQRGHRVRMRSRF